MNHNSLSPNTPQQETRWKRYSEEHWDWIPIENWPNDIAYAVMTGTLDYTTIFRWFIYLIGNGMEPEKAKRVVSKEVGKKPEKVALVEGLYNDLEKNLNDWTYWDETSRLTLPLSETTIIKSMKSRKREYHRPQRTKGYAMAYKKPAKQKTSGYGWVDGEMKWIGQKEYEYGEQNQVVDDPDRNPFLPKARIKTVEGNLFYGTSDYALVHCIAQDAVMGAGIALNFRNKYQDMPAYVKKQKPDIGSCVMYTSKFGQVVMNLVTKKLSSELPSMSALSRSLEALKKAVIYNKIKKIAMPKIGSGIDRLNWDKVLEQIELVFWDVDIEIKIFTQKSYWNKY